MAKKPHFEDAVNLYNHLAAGLEDGYVSEGQYILDNTATTKEGKLVTLQETIDNMTERTTNYVNNDDIDGIFVICSSNEEENDNEEP